METSKTNETYVKEINVLLASYQMHYQNLRSLHWNIKGAKFFELHLKYEELYNRAQIIIDEIAERVLTINGTPLSRFSDYLQHSVIKENELIRDGEVGMRYILEAQKSLLAEERKLLKVAREMNDEGTNAFLSDLIREKEKTNWMFSSWLS